jgi:hypothetical protein
MDKEWYFLLNPCTITSAGMGLIDLSDTCGKEKSLSK